MSRSRRSLLVLVITGLCAACLAPAIAPSPAAAQPQRVQQRVVVARVRGPRGSSVRSSLVRDLERAGVVVVDEDEVRAARRELGLGRSLDESQYVDLGRQLNVQAFITGRVRRRRRRWAVSLRVHNASDGSSVGAESWGGRTAASLRGVGRNGYERLAPYIDQTSSPGAVQTAPTYPDGETPWYARGEEENETPPGGDEEPAPAEPVDPGDVQNRYDALRFAFGLGTLFRRMETTVSVYAAQRGVPTPNPESEFLDEVRRYQSGGIGHFELGGYVEFYPGAFDEQPFPYLGLRLGFSNSVLVQSNGTDRMTGDPVPVPTNQLDFYIGARGRYRFGPNRREPELHIDVGYSAFNFDLGLAELQRIELDTIIPPMQYGFVQIGAGITYGIVPTYLTVGLDVAGRIGTNIGADTRNVWGLDTGAANGFEVTAEARVEIPEIVRGFFLALRLSFFQMITSFAGQVGCTEQNACGDFMNPWEDERLWEVWPVTPPVGGNPPDPLAAIGGPNAPVEDTYFRLQLQIGFQFY